MKRTAQSRGIDEVLLKLGNRRARSSPFQFAAGLALLTLLVGHLVFQDPTRALAAPTDEELADARSIILQETNAARVVEGLPPLVENNALNTVAQDWSKAQSDSFTMAHNPNYTAQYPAGWQLAAENVAMGFNVSDVVDAWLASPGHRSNILSSATDIGIGYYIHNGGRPYFTQNFARYPTPTPASTVGPTAVPTAAPTATPQSPAVTRLAGPDRFAASADVSRRNFSPGVATVYVANGLNFPDALSGAPVAARDGAPILLVSPTTLPASIAQEIDRLNPGRIVVLGGVNSVSASVLNDLQAFTPTRIERLAGADRFVASAGISARNFGLGASTVYVASGMNFPDALSGAPVAARDQGPILLVTPTSIPESIARELERLKPARIVILGGVNSVSAQVATDLAGFSDSIARRAGLDRFVASATVSAQAFSVNTNTVYVANGLNFPDALSGAPVAAQSGAPILLVTPTAIPGSIAAELRRLNPREIVVLGGTNSVSSTVEKDLAQFLRP